MKTGPMKRREFIRHAGYGLSAAWLTSGSLARAVFMSQPLPRKFSATDSVTLGNTGIKTSRLAMGTGTVGVGHHSHQTALGVAGLSALLLNGYDQGLRFFDAADSYGSHEHVAAALKQVPRDKVVVLTKTWARDPATSAPTSTASAKNWAPITSTSRSCTASAKPTGPPATAA